MLRGAKAMVPAIFLLTLAWSIAAVCNEMLGTGVVISRLVNHSHLGATAVPCLLFLVASALAFSTGAGCNHLAHVVTQLPYVIAVGIACAFGYAAAGVARSLGLGYLGILLSMLAVSFALLVVEFLFLPRMFPGKVAAARLRAARRSRKPVL